MLQVPTPDANAFHNSPSLSLQAAAFAKNETAAIAIGQVPSSLKPGELVRAV
jgi:hypothetical protein